MKFAFAIPTYNRLTRLKIALASMMDQVMPEGVEMVFVLSNSDSKDGTYEFLNELPAHYPRYQFFTSNLNDGGSVIDNWRRLAETVPVDVDWVWFMGDDDFLISAHALSRIVEVLRGHGGEDVHFIHACQARRASPERKVVRGTCLDLCNRFGFHELLGWMSSLVVRRNVFCDAIREAYVAGQDVSKVSAFLHSTALFGRLAGRQSVFIDEPLVEPQDLQQTDESIQRWAAESVGERYFLLLDDLKRLFDTGILQSGVTKDFFRYLTYSIYDRLSIQLIGEVLESQQIDARIMGHFRRLEAMANLFSASRERKEYQAWLQALGAQLTEYCQTSAALIRQRNALANEVKVLGQQVYEFKVAIN
jgi:glycosyltransferase involved in cell wall biosynthesis